MEYWTAFTLGLFGSLHCIGMCGPIALSLPYQSSSTAGTVLNMLLYNTGRTLSYTIIGLIPGILGLGVFIGGQQQNLSLILGILMIGFALFSINPEKYFSNNFFYNKFRKLFAKYIHSKKRSAFLSIGLLNGFLPCGMVYLAVAGSLIQGSIIASMTYMMFFGLGTLPLMLGLALSGSWINFRFRRYFRKATPLVLALFGILFIWRGMQVELPSDISFWLVSGMQKMCN